MMHSAFLMLFILIAAPLASYIPLAALAAVLFINRMAKTTSVETTVPLVADDKADDANGACMPYDAALATDLDIVVYRITGAFFFGAAPSIGSLLDEVAVRHKAFIVDFAAVPFLDSSAANTINRVAIKAQRLGIRLFIMGASPSVRRTLLTYGVRPPRARYRASTARALTDLGRTPQALSHIPALAH
jgi:SulP family sulfate permease